MASLDRIHVFLAKQGLGSRREVEGWIRSGFIQINKKPARLGQKIDPTIDKIRLRGKDLFFSRNQVTQVIALHKPRGVVTTMKDPDGRPTVTQLVPKNCRLYPVGRLDLNSEGLILMTNDGELSQKVTHPKYEVPKVYEVKI